MTHALAIATATATLVRLLQDSLAQADVPGAAVTSRPVNPPADWRGLNVILFNVTPDPAYRRAASPTRAAYSTATGFDLHYLITAHGDAQACEPERLLAASMLALADHPVLVPALIAAVKRARPDLRASTLDAQADPIRLTSTPQTLQDLSAIWSMLKLDFALSTRWTLGPVVIEAEPAAAPPVTERPV